MSAYPDARYVWFDGRIRERENVWIDPLSHGLHYGTGAFEGIRAYETGEGTSVFRLRDHLERLRASAEALGKTMPYSVSDLTVAVEDVINMNGLRSSYIRPLAFLDASGLGLNVAKHGFHVLIAAWGWGPYLGADALQKGIRLCYSRVTKTSSTMVPVTAKVTGNYVNSVLALSEALARGFDEAVLVNHEGDVAEGSGENLFAVFGEDIVTPRREDHLLSGITRDSILELAGDIGYACRESSLTPADLAGADEVFLTGTAAEVTPVRQLEDTLFGPPGRVTQTLQRAFYDVALGRGSLGERHTHWRHPVSVVRRPTALPRVFA